MDTDRYIEGNNVLFDTLLRSGRKGDDSRRKRTNLFFMLGLFSRRSHPGFHPSVSWSQELSPSLLLSYIFQRRI